MNSQLGFNETVSPDELVVRNGIFYKKFTDTPFIGEVSGQQNGNIKNGRPWEHYYENGQLTFKGNYKAGKEDGEFEYFKEDGTFEKIETWKNGKLTFD